MIGQHKTHTVSIFFAFCLIYGLIVINLYHMQIVQRSFFAQLGSQQYTTTITQSPPRASIFDRTGATLLAMNMPSVSAFITPNKLADPERLHAFLDEHFPEAAQRLARNAQRHFFYIKRRLSPEDKELIECAQIADIKLISEPGRFYPVPSAAPVIGLTGIENAGLCGIELSYEAQLAGTPTTFTLERDARSGHFYFQKTTDAPGKSGEPLQLTLDASLQFLVHEEVEKTVKQFDAKEGAAVILDPDSGDIIALVSVPCADPNNRETCDSAHLRNIPVCDCHELGSVIKVFAALAAIDEGVVTPDELIDCKNNTTALVHGRRVNTVIPHGIIPFSHVVAKSNNIGIALIAHRLDKKIYDHYLRLGFGTKLNLGLPGEQHGYVSPPQRWSKQSIISLSYGYEITASLVQLARAFSVIANDGWIVAPRFILSDAPPEKKQIYPATAIAHIKRILELTTKQGTAYRAALSGYTVMSKTGTANLLVNGAYDKTKNIYTCAGIVQKGNYKRVIVTFIKEANRENLYAATVAAPLFERVAYRMVIHERAV